LATKNQTLLSEITSQKGFNLQNIYKYNNVLK